MEKMSTTTLRLVPMLFARIAGVLVFLTGALVLVVGWSLDIPSFKSVVPGWPKMAAGSALGFALIGLAIGCAAATPPLPAGGGAPVESQRRWRRSVLRGCGIAVAIIGLLRLTELLTGRSFAVNQLWFNEPAALSAPARMAPA